MHPDFVKAAYDKFDERKERLKSISIELLTEHLRRIDENPLNFHLFPLSFSDVGDPDNGNSHTWSLTDSDGLMGLGFNTVLNHDIVIYGFADRLHDSCLNSATVENNELRFSSIFLQPDINWFGEYIMEKTFPVFRKYSYLTISFRANNPYNSIPIPLGYKAIRRVE